MRKSVFVPEAELFSRPVACLAAAVLSCLPLTEAARAAPPCGGDFSSWKAGVLEEARGAGVGAKGLAVLEQARRDPKVISMDRAQGVFAQSFLTFSDRTVSAYRLKIGRARLQQHANLFGRVESRYGVPGPVLAAFWGMETDYGANQGSFNTVNALATLAHDCRRPHLFRPQLINAARIVDRGYLPENRMRGAWAGELGQVQILPSDYLKFGVDFDGDGRVNVKDSVADSMATAANFLHHLGWQGGQPWLQEVRVPPDMVWHEADLAISRPRSTWAERGVTLADGSPLKPDGLPASLVLPMGRKGPAFLAFPNFRIFLEWNQSLVYTTSVAYFATRLAGAPAMRRGGAVEVLNVAEVKELQRLLQQRGHDVGRVDGIIGELTRAAVKREQMRLGLPDDSWPTRELLNRLR